MIHTFTVEVEAPEQTSRERIAHEIREGLNLTIGRVTKFDLHYTPNEPVKPKPKFGEPSFTFPPCDQCGSTSLRCGCD